MTPPSTPARGGTYQQGAAATPPSTPDRSGTVQEFRARDPSKPAGWGSSSKEPGRPDSEFGVDRSLECKIPEHLRGHAGFRAELIKLQRRFDSAEDPQFALQVFALIEDCTEGASGSGF